MCGDGCCLCTCPSILQMQRPAGPDPRAPIRSSARSHGGPPVASGKSTSRSWRPPRTSSPAAGNLVAGKAAGVNAEPVERSVRQLQFCPFVSPPILQVVQSCSGNRLDASATIPPLAPGAAAVLQALGPGLQDSISSHVIHGCCFLGDWLAVCLERLIVLQKYRAGQAAPEDTVTAFF